MNTEINWLELFKLSPEKSRRFRNWWSRNDMSFKTVFTGSIILALCLLIFLSYVSSENDRKKEEDLQETERIIAKVHVARERRIRWEEQSKMERVDNVNLKTLEKIDKKFKSVEKDMAEIRKMMEEMK